MPPSGQIAYFRVYPEPQAHAFCTVRIFATLAAMRAYVRSTGRSAPRGCKAMHRRSVNRSLGEVVFAQDWLLNGIVAHEAAHVALWWGRRVRLDQRPDAEVEERFATALGEISRQIAHQIWERGLAVPR